jgi:mannose-6-phosphate isomerase
MESGEMNLVSWMRELALPFWASRGVDHKYGGFVEELNQDGSPSNVGFKRVRVQGRQLFSFATAAILGWNKDAEAIAEQGYAFLKKACRAPDGYWVKKLSRNGSIIDTEIDLYDTAFIVLGLATYYRLTRNREALGLIESTLPMVQSRLSTSSPKGYRQSPSDKEVLRQNPNMHWFEAMLFCFEGTQDQRYLEEATKIYRRIEESVIDPKTGALRELFDNQWRPIQEGGKYLLEPGHHYEWSWLLSRAGNKIPVNPTLIQGILGFADRFGVNFGTGLVYDQVSDGGEVTQPTHRLWVQTEFLKAWLVRKDAKESDRERRIGEIEANLLKYYFTREPKGSWGDRLDADGRVHDGPVPASSMYHVMMCVVELWAWRSARENTGK